MVNSPDFNNDLIYSHFLVYTIRGNDSINILG